MCDGNNYRVKPRPPWIQNEPFKAPRLRPIVRPLQTPQEVEKQLDEEPETIAPASD